MVELDGDDIRISSRGKLAERDIVQVTLETMSDQRKKKKRYFFKNIFIYGHINIML